MSNLSQRDNINDIIYEETSHNQNYELLSMNVHSGTVVGGHYIAYSKINGIWYEENEPGNQQLLLTATTVFHFG